MNSSLPDGRPVEVFLPEPPANLLVEPSVHPFVPVRCLPAVIASVGNAVVLAGDDNACKSRHRARYQSEMSSLAKRNTTGVQFRIAKCYKDEGVPD